MGKNCTEQSLISMILRISMVCLFAVAAASKFTNGIETSATFIVTSFKDTFLPAFLVNLYAHVLPFAEALIAIWLLIGFKLRAAWVFTALVLVSLAFGLVVAKQSAADNYMYVLFACAGLYFSAFDCCVLGSKK